MNIVIFGATGMVGQGALRACLLDPDVRRILVIGRSPAGQLQPKLHELILLDMTDYTDIEPELTGYDSCFYCLGVSSFGMDEQSYSRTTYDLALAAASVLSRLNPGMTFIYISGAGADATEHSRTMWARVKGRTENAVRSLPFKAVYVFRPGAIQALHGIRSKTRSYRMISVLAGPLFSVLRWVIPQWVLTTDNLGRAMIAVGRHGATKAILGSRDLYEASRQE